EGADMVWPSTAGAEVAVWLGSGLLALPTTLIRTMRMVVGSAGTVVTPPVPKHPTVLDTVWTRAFGIRSRQSTMLLAFWSSMIPSPFVSTPYASCRSSMSSATGTPSRRSWFLVVSTLYLTHASLTTCGPVLAAPLNPIGDWMPGAVRVTVLAPGLIPLHVLVKIQST